MSKPLSPEKESLLISQLSTNPEAFQPLYEQYFPRVFAYTAYRVATRQETEDMTATIFMKVIQSIHQFEYRGVGSFAMWLFRIAHNEIQQHYRETYRHNTIPLDELPDIASHDLLPDESLARKEQFSQLREALLTLSPRRQEIIRLRYFGGLRNQDIAKVLGLDERTVASHLSRGLDDLKSFYREEAKVLYEE